MGPQCGSSLSVSALSDDDSTSPQWKPDDAVLVPEAHDAADRLVGQAGHFGGEVEGEGELDQLRGRRVLRQLAGDLLLHVAVGQLLEGAVGQALEEGADANAVFDLGRETRPFVFNSNETRQSVSMLI
ncbi:hypothetical protein JZ751_003434 [Albula glossodonta]|uniref:Uncharacterized protein n=1 Tax=Albula glossodonta TaxID=121402 RepID=A0A8T2N6D6_9TELE|nr:hypothetical protein JZ751_003434 [Albula glossodonta]